MAKALTQEAFWRFSARLPVASRDAGLGPIKPWGTQRVLIDEIFRGLADGARQFVVLKGGQVGATLIVQQLTLWWMQQWPGLQGVCVTDSDELRDYLRDNLVQMSAPTRLEPRLNNRHQIAWNNASRLLFMTAGPRTSRRLGIGRGVALCHGTEVSRWPDGRALTYLRTRFSDVHPAALYIYESTAFGRNWFCDLWEEAGGAATLRRIFLGWWLREDYRLDLDSPVGRQYWDGRLTPEERRLGREVERRWGVVIEPAQWAWRRWYIAEKAGGDRRVADQEEPTLPEHAFEASGQSFVPPETRRIIWRGVQAAPTPQCWRWEFGAMIEETKLIATRPAFATLRVWESQADQRAAYIVSAVPAWSADPACGWYVAQVWRAERDQLVQVAEFADTECGLQPFAWILVALLSAWGQRPRSWILEIAGAGMGVLAEIRRLATLGWGARVRETWVRQLAGMRPYIWRRPDNVLGSGAYLQHKTTPDLQGQLFLRLRDQLVAGRLVIRSDGLAEELERLRQDGATFTAEGREPAMHRAHAAALAIESWSAQLLPLFGRVQGPEAASVMDRLFRSFIRDLEVTRGAAR